MVPLFALKLSFSFWKLTLSLSKRLSGRTWVALGVMNAAIAVGSFWAYQAKGVPESAIPPVYQASLPLRLMLESNADTHFVPYLWGGIDRQPASLIKPSFGSIVFFRSPGLNHVGIVTDASGRYYRTSSQPFLLALKGANYHVHLSLMLERKLNDTPFGWKTPRWPIDEGRVVVQLQSDAPGLFTPTQQVVAILVSIVTTLLAALNAFLAWQVYRRGKAQEILLQLQIAKIQKELADLNTQDEEARKEAERSSLILLD